MKWTIWLFGAIALLCASVQSADKSVCTQPCDTGPCRAGNKNYYYDSEAKECKSFIYGGCLGNGNRFETKQECEKTCK